MLHRDVTGVWRPEVVALTVHGRRWTGTHDPWKARERSSPWTKREPACKILVQLMCLQLFVVVVRVVVVQQRFSARVGDGKATVAISLGSVIALLIRRPRRSLI